MTSTPPWKLTIPISRHHLVHSTASPVHFEASFEELGPSSAFLPLRCLICRSWLMLVGYRVQSGAVEGERMSLALS